MMIRVNGFDRPLFHVREVFVCRWDSEMEATQQYLMAENVFTTKQGAKRWVRRQVITILEQNGSLVYNG